MPAAKRKGAPRGRKPRGGKKAEDAQLFVLTALVFILFALLASLVLAVRNGEKARPALAVGADRPAVEGPAETPSEPGPEYPREPPPEAQGAGRIDRDPPEERRAPEKAGSEEREAEPEKAPTAPPASKPASKPAAPKTERNAAKPAAPPERPKKGEIIIVIDDVGDNIRVLEPFLKFPGPITFAIKPGLALTRKCRDMIRLAGKDYIIHQPMEALDKLDPGPGALYSGMEDAKIQEILRNNYAELPGAKGMNNHMGSVGTRDLALMRQVLRFTKSKNIPFLDSRTIGGTATEEAARLENAVYGERDVFLDNSPEREKIIAMFKEGQKAAEKRGRAVMIGHVWSAELAQTLMELYPELVSEGYSLSTISRIMVGDDDDDVDPGY